MKRAIVVGTVLVALVSVLTCALIFRLPFLTRSKVQVGITTPISGAASEQQVELAVSDDLGDTLSCRSVVFKPAPGCSLHARAAEYPGVAHDDPTTFASTWRFSFTVAEAAGCSGKVEIAPVNGSNVELPLSFAARPER